MKYYNLFFYIAVYAALSGAIPAQQDTCISNINITTDRDSSAIYINKEFVGYGKTTLTLPVGVYIVEARESEKGWGGAYFTDTLQLNECGISKNINFKFKGKLLLSTSPSDVSVLSNGSLIGKTPLFITREYTYLTLQKKEYSDITLDLNKYKAGETIAMEYLGEEKKTGFIKTPVFKYLMAGIAVLGATAVYFKLEADDNYDKYLETKDRNYLDKTNSYDLISGISMGALQINLGVLAYLFLSD